MFIYHMDTFIRLFCNRDVFAEFYHGGTVSGLFFTLNCLMDRKKKVTKQIFNLSKYLRQLQMILKK